MLLSSFAIQGISKCFFKGVTMDKHHHELTEQGYSFYSYYLVIG
jgi:hypothetical protein